MILHKLNFLSKINVNKMIPLTLIGLMLFLICYQITPFFFSSSLVILPPKPTTVKPEFKITANSELFKVALFGMYVPNLPENIKQSTLNAKIVGIIYSKKTSQSQVIVQVNGQEKIYLIGDILPGGAEIKRINEKDIVILYNGALEKLTFPTASLKFSEPLKPLFKE